MGLECGSEIPADWRTMPNLTSERVLHRRPCAFDGYPTNGSKTRSSEFGNLLYSLVSLCQTCTICTPCMLFLPFAFNLRKLHNKVTRPATTTEHRQCVYQVDYSSASCRFVSFQLEIEMADSGCCMKARNISRSAEIGHCRLLCTTLYQTQNIKDSSISYPLVRRVYSGVWISIPKFDCSMSFLSLRLP